MRPAVTPRAHGVVLFMLHILFYTPFSFSIIYCSFSTVVPCHSFFFSFFFLLPSSRIACSYSCIYTMPVFCRFHLILYLPFLPSSFPFYDDLLHIRATSKFIFNTKKSKRKNIICWCFCDFIKTKLYLFRWIRLLFFFSLLVVLPAFIHAEMKVWCRRNVLNVCW